MTTTAAAWFAVAFFLLPGLLISWIAGMKLPAAFASALPVTFGVIGMGAWMWGLTPAPFNSVTYTVTIVFALLAAGVWRYAFARKARRGGMFSWQRALFPGDARARSVLDPTWVLPGVGIIVGAWLCIADRLDWLERTPNGTYNIVQGWDVQWHANAVRFIMETGVASPTRMGELQNIETHADLLYPSAFHAGIALFARAAGLEAIPALNIASAVLTSLAFPITLACLVFAFMRSRGMTAQIGAGLAAIAVYAAPQILWIPDYVGMWPYMFAIGLTGISIWQFLNVPGAHASALPAAIGFLGVVTVHPSAVTVVALAVVLSWLTSTLVTPERSRLSDTVWMAGPALGASLVFLPQVFAGSTQAEEVTAWEAVEDASIYNGWETAFMMKTRHVGEFFASFDPTVALWLAGFGALVLLVWRRQVWPVLFYFISLTVCVNVLQPFDNVFGDMLAVLGNLHYNTAHRLIMPVAMSVVAAAAIGVAAMIRLVTLAPLAVRKANPVWLRATAVASAVAALLVGAFAAPAIRAETLEGAEDAYVSSRESQRMVTNDDLAAFAWLASQPAAHEGYTLGDPSDGHSWIYALKGVPTISRHYQWPTGGRGSNTDIAFWHADALGEGLRGQPNAKNVADEAVSNLNVKFYLLSGAPFWAYQRTQLQLNRALWVTAGVTPVYRKGEIVIFAVNDAFTANEIARMQSDALAHGSDELFAFNSTTAPPEHPGTPEAPRGAAPAPETAPVPTSAPAPTGGTAPTPPPIAGIAPSTRPQPVPAAPLVPATSAPAAPVSSAPVPPAPTPSASAAVSAHAPTSAAVTPVSGAAEGD